MNCYIINHFDGYVDYEKLNIKEQLDEIFDDDDNVSLDTCDQTSIFEMINKYVDCKINVSVFNIWENKDYLYNAYYNDARDVANSKINNFASQITGQPVTGKLVIIKHKLTYTIVKNNIKTDTTLDSISHISELVNVCYTIMHKDGIVITPDGVLNTYKYIINPIDYIIATDRDYTKHYVYHEYEIYTYILLIFADTRETEGKLNEKGTLLAGHPVNGPIHVALYKKPLYNEQPPYASLSIDTLNMILNLRSKSPELTTGLTQTEKEYINFENLLHIECNRHSDKPQIDPTTVKGQLLNLK